MVLTDIWISKLNFGKISLERKSVIGQYMVIVKNMQYKCDTPP